MSKLSATIEQIISKMPKRSGREAGVTFFVGARGGYSAFSVYAGGPLHVSTHNMGEGSTPDDAARALLHKIEGG